MQRIKASFEITTPMFLGGANQENTAELKSTSVKGVLRFWYRAINYGRYQEHEKIKQHEDYIFGSTKSQSKLYLNLGEERLEITTYDNNNEKRFRTLFKQGASYLGYGLDYEKGSQKKYRPFINASQRFNITILSHPSIKGIVDLMDLIKPFEALGLFGGLGSRSRRGFGSLTLKSIEVDDKSYWSAPKTKADLEKNYKDFYSSIQLKRENPEYTAFSFNSKTVILKGFNDYKLALNELGSLMLNFRRDCKSDGQIVSHFLRSREVKKHPKKVAFGLPHNYFFPGLGAAEINPIVFDNQTRRASPLFMKIISIKSTNGIRYFPVLSLLPAQFLPPNSTIVLSGKSGRKKLKPDISYDIVNQFLDYCMAEMDGLEVKPSD